MFNISSEASLAAIQILNAYTVASILLYPASFSLPNALRGTGDTRYVMLCAVCSMFLFRIGMAYVFVKVFKVGVIGIWYAMFLDWIIRSILFAVRFRLGKWKKNKVI